MAALHHPKFVGIATALLLDQTVFGRVKRALNAQTHQQVADALGAKLGTVKSWSARGIVPLRWLIRCSRRSGRSMQWLVLGENPTGELAEELSSIDSQLAQFQAARDWFGPMLEAQHGVLSEKPLRK